MVVLFVVSTVLFFLIVDYFVQLHESKAFEKVGEKSIARVAQSIAPIRPENFILPDGLFISKNHLWNEILRNGTLRVGMDNFITHALGQIDKIILPKAGTVVTKGQTLFTLNKGDHSMIVKSPVSGVINRANSSVENFLDSSQVEVEKQWMLEIEPQNISLSLKALKIGQDAQKWMKDEINRFREFLNEFTTEKELALTMQDGGMPVKGALTHVEAVAWKEFESQFLS